MRPFEINDSFKKAIDNKFDLLGHVTVPAGAGSAAGGTAASPV
jgi:hypothetical protein